MSALPTRRRSLSTLTAQVPTYVKIATLTSQIAYTYRFNILLQLVGLLLQIFLLRAVWTAIYADRASVDGVDLETLLTYLTIANLQLWIVFPEGGEILQRRVREGKVALDLARPVSLVGQLISQQVGYTFGLLPLLLAVTPVAFVVGVLRLPSTPEAGAAYVLSLLFAYGVIVLIGLLLGMVSFWTMETTGMWAIYRFANLFFSGGLVPLWLFPEPLRTIAGLLPFQTQANTPVSIYVGRLTGDDTLRALLLQCLWMVLLAVLVRFVWSKAIRRVVIQGG